MSSCTKDIKSQLRQLKAAQTSVVSEKDLILARVGLFDLDGNDMTVCPKHRAGLGTWPGDQLLNVIILCMAINDENREEEQACRCRKEIMSKWKVLVPVGAGMFLF